MIIAAVFAFAFFIIALTSIIELRAERRRGVTMHHLVERGEARLDAIITMIREEMKKDGTFRATVDLKELAQVADPAQIYKYPEDKKSEIRKAVQRAILERDRTKLTVVDGGDGPKVGA